MFQDLRYAARTLRKNAGFALVAIISLALGIGANSAIFSMANGLLLRPLHVPHASSLLVVQSHLRGESLGGMFQYSQLSYPDFADLRDRAQSFAGLTASEYSAFGYTLDKGSLPRMKFGVLASWNFFRVLGVEPALGRDFRADEDSVPGRDAVAILSYDLWKTDFAARPDAIGQTIYLNGIAFTVIGVAPEGLNAPVSMIASALYVPFAMAPRLAGDHANTAPGSGSTPDADRSPLERRGDRQVFVHGRLKPGVSVAQAAAEALVVSRQLSQAYADTNKTCSLVVGTDMQSRLRQNPADMALVGILLAMAVVVLLIACANVMNLMLSRGRARQREIAVRLAIGAGRGRLVRQLLAESLLVALFGGALGLIVAQAGAGLFSQIRIPTDIPVVIEFGLDTRVLLFTLLVAITSVVLFGLLPALQSTNPGLTTALKTGGVGAGRRSRFLGRNALVIGQVAGSLLLLVFATQAYRGAAIVLSSPAGFRTDHLLTANFDTSLARYSTSQTSEFYKRMVERCRALPGVKAAALTEAVPMLPGGGQDRIVPEGVQLPQGAEAVSVVSNTVSGDYFDVMDIPIVEGRAFQATDKTDSRRVAIVNELFAHKYFPKQSAVGRRFRLNSAAGQPVEIVGVARQSHYFFPVEPPFDFIYQPLSQNSRTAMTLVLHTAAAPGALAAPLREVVHSLDPTQPVISIRTMDDVYDQRARKTMGVLIGALAGLGVLGMVLAMVGLYGLMTYSVGLRQREIGIRMAIGANQTGVLEMIMRQGMTLAAIGAVLGLLLWLLASRPVMTFVQASSFSWSLLGLVTTGLLAAAALGAWFPARRASQVDPNKVLRQD